MRALFKSTNLIGDGLNIAPALRLWHKLNPDVEIEFMTLPDSMQEVYTRMGVPLTINTTGGQFLPDEEYVIKHVFDCGQAFMLGDQKKIHIAIAYAEALGVPLDPSEESSYKLTYEPVEVPHAKDLILVSPFSRSCSSNEGLPPNKMIPFPAWGPLLRYLRSLNSPIGILGGPNDRMEGLDISEEEYYTGLSLNEVALMMRDCRFLVTIDNGMAHLAATQDTPMIEFYPECLGFHWIAPVGNPNLQLIQLNPAAIHPPQLLWILKDLIAKVLAAKNPK